MPDFKTWDTNLQNLEEPSAALFDNGFLVNDTPSSSNMNYILHYITSSRIPVGVQMPYLGVETSPDFPQGFLSCNGETLGSAASGAVKNQDKFEQLFVYLWDNFSTAVISGGKGASAVADWTANKTITLPNMAGRTMAGVNTTGAFAVASGAVVGAETVTLTAAQQVNMPVTGTIAGQTSGANGTIWESPTNGFGPSGAAAGLVNSPQEPALTFTASGSGTTVGGGQPHNNVQPTFVCGYIIKW